MSEVKIWTEVIKWIYFRTRRVSNLIILRPGKKSAQFGKDRYVETKVKMFWEILNTNKQHMAATRLKYFTVQIRKNSFLLKQHSKYITDLRNFKTIYLNRHAQQLKKSLNETWKSVKSIQTFIFCQFIIILPKK